jgi:hypothetical protein
LVEGSLVVNSSQGGGSKDTWVLAGSMERAEASNERGLHTAGGPLHVGVPAPAPHIGQAQQQQQAHDDDAAQQC